MYRKIRITSLYVVFLFLIMTITNVFAASAIEPGRLGSITVQIRYHGQTVPGGSIALYRVASLSTELIHTPEPEFAECGAVLQGTFSAAMIRDLARFAAEHVTPDATADVGAEGQVAFRDLKTGLYLLRQVDAADGYLPISPFVVSIPMMTNDIYCYDVDASPKVALKPSSTGSTVPTSPDLPHTGQFNRPIPMLIALGLILLVTGSILCLGSRKRS